MICQQCGYVMSELDAECSRCARGAPQPTPVPHPTLVSAEWTPDHARLTPRMLWELGPVAWGVLRYLMYCSGSDVPTPDMMRSARRWGCALSLGLSAVIVGYLYLDAIFHTVQ